MNALHKLFASLIATMPTRGIKPTLRGMNSQQSTIRREGPRIDARKARRSGKTTHRQQKRERMAALRGAK